MATRTDAGDAPVIASETTSASRPGLLIGLSVSLAAGTGLWLVAVHAAEGSTERHEPLLFMHWLRDAALALPLVVAAVAGALELVVLVSRRARFELAPRWLREATPPLVVAHAAAVAFAVAGPFHAFLFGAHDDTGFLNQVARDIALGLGVTVPISVGVWLVSAWLRRGSCRGCSRTTAARSSPAFNGTPSDPLLTMATTRRSFLRYGFAGVTVAAVGAHRLVTWDAPAHAATTEDLTASLYINAGDYLMIDDHPVFMRRFTPTEQWPDPISQTLDERHASYRESPNMWKPLEVEEGRVVDLSVTNMLDEPHQFVVTDVEAVSPDPLLNPPIAPGETRRFTFDAPAPGTYIFHDENPVNRVLGLAGCINVLPRDGIAHYLGMWDAPGVHEITRDQTWIFHGVDDRWGELARAGTSVDEIFGVTGGCLPRYFMINGKSGVASSNDPATVVRGHIGEPALLRLCNTGLALHSPHFHGNHVLRLTIDGQPQTPLMWKDIVVLSPLNRVEVVLPFKEPPDVVPGTLEALAAAGMARDQEGHHWQFPMHCHAEMSQSAGGGSYPQGALADWEVEGP